MENRELVQNGGRHNSGWSQGESRGCTSTDHKTSKTKKLKNHQLLPPIMPKNINRCINSQHLLRWSGLQIAGLQPLPRPITLTMDSYRPSYTHSKLVIQNIINDSLNQISDCSKIEPVFTSFKIFQNQDHLSNGNQDPFNFVN